MRRGRADAGSGLAAADVVAGDDWRTRLLAAAAGGANLGEWLKEVPEDRRRPGLIALAAVLARETGGDPLAILEDGVRQHPTDFWLHLAFGEVGPAVPPDVLAGAYRTALALRPETAVAHNNLGAALYAQGDRDAAAREFRTAVRLDPQLALARVNLGVVLDELGDRAGAARELREAVRLDAGQAAAHRGLGLLLAEAGDRAGAAREFREAVRLDPTDAAARDSLGTALDGDGDLKGAVRELREAVRLAPRHHVAHYNLGSALMKAGDLPAAAAAFRDAARMQPRNRAYHKALARVDRWQALVPRLPDLVAGRLKPADPAEALAFADLCPAVPAAVPAGRAAGGGRVRGRPEAGGRPRGGVPVRGGQPRGPGDGRPGRGPADVRRDRMGVPVGDGPPLAARPTWRRSAGASPVHGRRRVDPVEGGPGPGVDPRAPSGWRRCRRRTGPGGNSSGRTWRRCWRSDPKRRRAGSETPGAEPSKQRRAGSVSDRRAGSGNARLPRELRSLTLPARRV